MRNPAPGVGGHEGGPMGVHERQFAVALGVLGEETSHRLAGPGRQVAAAAPGAGRRPG